MSDFRSDPMPSPDGLGKAKNNFQKVWAAYVKALEPATKALEPALDLLARPVAQVLTFDLFGFWLAWHLEGGFEGLQRPRPGGLGMSRSAVYRRISMFRRMTGKHPDEYSVPGITIDVDAYWADAIEKGKRPTRPENL
jgi:hypothetical protein